MDLARHHRIDEVGSLPTESLLPVSQVLTDRGPVKVVRIGQGEPIVIVAGLAGGWPLVTPLARRLSQFHEVILYQLAGDESGLRFPRRESISDYAQDLASILDHLNLERPAILGVSFGGAIALELAVEQPSRFGALIVSGMAPKFSRGLASRIALRVLECYPLPHDSPFVNQFFNLLHAGRPESPLLADEVVKRLWTTDQGVMAARLRALFEFDVSDRLWRVDCPSLILAGGKDIVISPTSQKALAQAVSGARYAEFTNAGHIGFLTHYDVMGRHVHRLLRDRQRAAWRD